MPTSVKQISFLKYNNYANRTTHPGDTFEDIFGAYNSLTGRYANEIARINEPKLWNPNDGITSVIVTPNNTDFSTEPDYLVVWFTVSDEIESRWFVTETVRLHQGQYQCLLRRDVFSEAWDELMAASCNIHRAILNKTNSLIFNKEPITVNQILEKETMLKDKTGCPWIVFYGDSAFGPDDYIDVTPNMQYDFAVNNLSEITGNPDPTATTGTRLYLGGTCFSISFTYKDRFDANQMIPVYPFYQSPDYQDGVPLSNTGATPWTVSPPKLLASVTYDVSMMNFLPIWRATSTWLDIDNGGGDILSMIGKLIYNRADQKYYRFYTTPATQPTPVSYVLNTAPDEWWEAFESVFSKDNFEVTCTGWTSSDEVNYTHNNFVLNCRPIAIGISLTEVSVPGTVTARIPNGYLPNDNPYSIWCMPYGDIDVVWNGVTYTTDKDLNKNIATAISRRFSRDKIWDVQILPYCPIPDEYFVNGKITTNDTMLTKSNTITDDNNNIRGFIFCVPQSSFETQITLDTPITITDPKVSDICDTWRLCSPNYGSLFEFSAAKNEGIYGFNVRCTYMPIQPYIRVAPMWGGLYGDEMFKYDTRGLILGGDFSIARIDDKWVQYQENNKNYSAIFDRQLNNMDVMREIQREQEKWGVAAGVIQGATSGAIAGSAAGPYGAAAGALVGGIGAGVTGAMDRQLSEKAYVENRDYATDVHNLTLMNVQAMPRSIAKTTAFNIDNRYFPILAHYTCTLTEKGLVEKFIQNHSMLVDAIGTPGSFINNTWTSSYGVADRGFIQGSIIKIDTVHDTHFVDALNDEFQKGVYTK